MTYPGTEDHYLTRQPGPGQEFPATRWTLIRRVRQGGVTKQAALEDLCGLYWYPIYAFLRRRGYARHDAEDFTQGFFMKLLNDETFAAADGAKGRLRNFLLESLRHHLADQLRREHAQKRGGGQRPIAFEELQAEERYALEPQDQRDPESLFARAWAHSLVAESRDKLRQSFADSDRRGAFEILLPFVVGEDPPLSYRDVASQLEASETSVRVLVFRMRAQFRELLRETVARTVLPPQDVEEELRWVKSMLASGPP